VTGANQAENLPGLQFGRSDNLYMPDEGILWGVECYRSGSLYRVDVRPAVAPEAGSGNVTARRFRSTSVRRDLYRRASGRTCLIHATW
jgi:hypothetical protein